MNQSASLIIAGTVGYILATLNILPIVLGFVACAVVCHGYPPAHDWMDRVSEGMRSYMARPKPIKPDDQQ